MRMLRLLLAGALFSASAAHAVDGGRIEGVADAAGFSGAILVSQGDTIHFERTFGTVRPDREEPHRLGMRWRWASISKQVVATLIMQQVERGHIALDSPIGTYLPSFPNPRRDDITVRQLLRHLSGLPNPDDTPPNAEGLPTFYAPSWTGGPAATGYCAGPLNAEPGTVYRYNNCDYLVLGALLERVTGKPLDSLIAERIGGGIAIYPNGLPEIAGYGGGRAEPPIRLAAYGAAGGLNGTLRTLWQFDRRLMRGELLGREARAEMWRGAPEYGYMALGQWSYAALLSGCAGPVTMIERRGAIGGIQGVNVILPDLDMAVIAFTNRGESDFGFGEIWRGEGFLHDLLAAAACAEAAE